MHDTFNMHLSCYLLQGLTAGIQNVTPAHHMPASQFSLEICQKWKVFHYEQSTQRQFKFFLHITFSNLETSVLVNALPHNISRCLENQQLVSISIDQRCVYRLSRAWLCCASKLNWQFLLPLLKHEKALKMTKTLSVILNNRHAFTVQCKVFNRHGSHAEEASFQLPPSHWFDDSRENLDWVFEETRLAYTCSAIMYRLSTRNCWIFLL